MFSLRSRFAAAAALLLPLALAGCAADADAAPDEEVAESSEALVVNGSVSGAKAARLYRAMKNAGIEPVPDLMSDENGNPFVYYVVGAFRIACEASPVSCRIRPSTGYGDPSPFTAKGSKATELRAALDAIKNVDSTPTVRDADCKKVGNDFSCKMKIVR